MTSSNPFVLDSHDIRLGREPSHALMYLLVKLKAIYVLDAYEAMGYKL